jgi:hypothetical protein
MIMVNAAESEEEKTVPITKTVIYFKNLNGH